MGTPSSPIQLVVWLAVQVRLVASLSKEWQDLAPTSCTGSDCLGWACRGATPLDKDPSYYELHQGVSDVECKALCEQNPLCVGVMTNNISRCEVWTRRAGIETVAPPLAWGGTSCLRYGWPVTTLVPFGPANDSACRRVESEVGFLNSRSFYTLTTALSEAGCRARCAAAPICYGIEYNAATRRCEIWVQPIQSFERVSGYSCWRFPDEQLQGVTLRGAGQEGLAYDAYDTGAGQIMLHTGRGISGQNCWTLTAPVSCSPRAAAFRYTVTGRECRTNFLDENCGHSIPDTYVVTSSLDGLMVCVVRDDVGGAGQGWSIDLRFQCLFPAPFASKGLLSWFKSEKASATGWPSEVGGHVGSVTLGSVTVVREAGHGASAVVTSLTGGTEDSYIFGAPDFGAPRLLGIYPAGNFTVCAVTRYTGCSKGRILTGQRWNWLHGHWRGHVGVAFYGGWTTPVTNAKCSGGDSLGNTDWAVTCGTNGAPLFLVNGVNVATSFTQTGSNQQIVINDDPSGGERSEWAVMELMTWNRALSEAEMRKASDYLVNKLGGLPSMPSQPAEATPIAFSPQPTTGPFPSSGMMSWFKSEKATAQGWPSDVGGFVGRATSGSVTLVQEAGNGASAVVTSLAGSTEVSYSFGKILSETFSVCAVTRYTGCSRGRILTGQSVNWLHGHWRGHVGVAFYNGWMSPVTANKCSGLDSLGNTDWAVTCGTNRARVFLVNGVNLATTFTNLGGNQGVVINGGSEIEPSDWAVMELMTWNRVLSEAEMRVASNYLINKLLGVATVTPQPAEVAGPFSSVGLKSWFKSEKATVQSWPSEVGGYVGRATSGLVTLVREAGNGASSVVASLAGSTDVSYSFGTILAQTYSICAVTRYTGCSRGRILTGQSVNWLHGHWRGHVGVAFYYGWMSPVTANKCSGLDSLGNTNWAVVCGTNGAALFLVNGVNVATTFTNLGGNQGVVINGGSSFEPSDWAVMELMTWNRVLSEAEMRDASNYLVNKLGGLPTVTPQPAEAATTVAFSPLPTPGPLPSSGLMSWFKSEKATAQGWPSEVGGFVGGVTSGSVTLVQEASNGASAVVTSLAGSTEVSYSFGTILAQTYSICAVTRYTGCSRGRILTGQSTNWLHGHWRGQVGVAFYYGWMSQVTSAKCSGGNSLASTDWAVTCGTNGAALFLVNGVNVATTFTNLGGNQGVVINGGSSFEPSEWAVMEVMTWNRVLSEAEMRAASGYLTSKLAGIHI